MTKGVRLANKPPKEADQWDVIFSYGCLAFRSRYSFSSGHLAAFIEGRSKVWNWR